MEEQEDLVEKGEGDTEGWMKRKQLGEQQHHRLDLGRMGCGGNG